MTPVNMMAEAAQPPTVNPRNHAVGTLDSNAFLTLLVAELQYQDPTKPMDTTQLVQQLAAMSQVEQSAQTNTKLASILDQLALGQPTSLIGRDVKSADGEVSGIVSAVKITDSGTQAILADGTAITIEPGITIGS